MKKPPRFLICHNPLIDQPTRFILCTRPSKVLFELTTDNDGKFNLQVQDIFSGSDLEAQAALDDARSWYIALLAAGKK